MWQEILVVAVLLTAIVYLVARITGVFKPKQGTTGGCASCKQH